MLRLFLRWDVVENGEEVMIGGVRGRMDRDEQKSLGSDTGSVCESARLMRTAMHLHYEHHFTHAASVDGSKAGTIKDAYQDSEEERESAEDALAPAAYGVWEGVRPFGKVVAGEAMVESTEAEKLAAVLAGMGGGRLPKSASLKRVRRRRAWRTGECLLCVTVLRA